MCILAEYLISEHCLDYWGIWLPNRHHIRPTVIFIDPNHVLWFCDYTCWWIASFLVLTKASLMKTSSEFVPVWQLPSSRDALSGFLRCVVARFYQQHTPAHCVAETFWNASRWHTSKRGKETTQRRTVDLAGSSKSCCLRLSLVAVCFLFHCSGFSSSWLSRI